MENWYKDLTISELVNMTTRLTMEIINKESGYTWKEVADLQEEVERRLKEVNEKRGEEDWWKT